MEHHLQQMGALISANWHYALYAVLGYLFIWKPIYWLIQGQMMRRSGHLPPDPSRFARVFFCYVTRATAYMGVGPLKIVGKRPSQWRSRLMIVCNHTHPLDGALTRRAIGVRFSRFLMSREQMFMHGGWIGRTFMPALWAWVGGIPVGYNSAKERAQVVPSCIKAMMRRWNAVLAIYQQGELIRDNVSRPHQYRHGASRTLSAVQDGIEAEKKLGWFRRLMYRLIWRYRSASPVGVLPVGLHYLRDRVVLKDGTFLEQCHPVHRHWTDRIGFIAKSRRSVRYKDAELGRTVQVNNYGAIVVIGEVIPVEQLPREEKERTEYLRLEIDKLVKRAQAIAAEIEAAADAKQTAVVRATA